MHEALYYKGGTLAQYGATYRKYAHAEISQTHAGARVCIFYSLCCA